jgi:hypothetical protein
MAKHKDDEQVLPVTRLKAWPKEIVSRHPRQVGVTGPDDAGVIDDIHQHAGQGVVDALEAGEKDRPKKRDPRKK